MPRIKFIDEKIKIQRWNTFEHRLFEEAIQELLIENKRPSPKNIFLKIKESCPSFDKTKTQVQTHLQKYKLKNWLPAPFIALEGEISKKEEKDLELLIDPEIFLLDDY